jgi:hypothetical protein
MPPLRSGNAQGAKKKHYSRCERTLRDVDAAREINGKWCLKMSGNGFRCDYLGSVIILSELLDIGNIVQDLGLFMSFSPGFGQD